MEILTIEQYREYLIKRIKILTNLVERFEGSHNLPEKAAELYLKAYSDLDYVMNQLFIIDNADDLTD